MKEIARSYFVKLFSSGIQSSTDRILSGIEACVSDEDNKNLKASFTEEEIWTALTEMGPTKAPGEDGLPAIFYQKCWPIIGKEVMNYCLQQLNNEMDVSTINKTNIVLIPKVSCPSNISQFRPISLCNVLYKLIAKAISNRLRTAGKKGYMAVKIDMSKAYDRVMKKMGFEKRWVDMILKCVSTVSYSVTVNGLASESFIPFRGLRQGDPLSPFLFLFCGEGLSSLMRLANAGNRIKGVKASRNGPTITHLLFADDCIVFAEATDTGAISLKQILREYAMTTGQCVNFDKSTVFFSKNTPESEKTAVLQILTIRISNDIERYLGLPNMVGRKKRSSFQNLKDRLNQKNNKRILLI
ncbi:reverse transcriptase [Gossypium australe]|uniref:Reverse transcriptase n=1 Tax=Gossypium australe TaxID=47621 RepID=A0A5B6UAR6_9ROSI|nr:reverse transcriptase [Gossypium australe]